MITAYIAIGSNLGDPVRQANQAVSALKELADSHFDCVSDLYSSQPMGPQDQPDYINAVAKIYTKLSPIELLDKLQAIELQQGRERKLHWGARTLDLDILLYGDKTICTERLTIPHYGMKSRNFVLYPLAQICPDLQFPDGTQLQELLKNVNQDGLSVWDHPPSIKD